jgi:hypothetical protein
MQGIAELFESDAYTIKSDSPHDKADDTVQ